MHASLAPTEPPESCNGPGGGGTVFWSTEEAFRDGTFRGPAEGCLSGQSINRPQTSRNSTIREGRGLGADFALGAADSSSSVRGDSRKMAEFHRIPVTSLTHVLLLTEAA
jgi:hypothetical protein